MKKFLSAAISLVLVCAMAVSMTGCGSNANKAYEEKIAELEKTNSELQEQIAALNAQLDELESGSLRTWKMDAVAWSDGKGASVTFTGEPRGDHEGQSAQFAIRLDGSEVASLPCDWNGSAYTATAELEAADGYSYSCVLISADGSRTPLPLSSPDSPIYDTLVYMKTSLNAYCNLFVADWSSDEKALNITSGYVQVQLPQITVTGTVKELAHAKLEFQLNGSTIASQTLELPAGEGAGSYETALTSVSFDMPKMEDDYQLDLLLVVDFTDGESITASGGSWYYNNNQLNMLVG